MENEKVFIEALLNPKTQQNAFRELLHLYQKPLYFHIRNIVLNHDDADDVLQNTFLKIYQNLSNFKGESKLYSWMYRIATNEALNFINQKARKNGTTIEEWQNKAINSLESDTYYDGDEIQLKLQKAIADLPEKQQLVFKMKYFQEMKYEEISEIVDTSVGALKASYHIAVKKIEEYLKNN
ncbi:RNA polymerase subunit sigma-70 [Flavobacterium sediminis]|uniref:RNA polymerase subunit sigma-70 n=1 Tax=Flavobacterium sediminis TaxID=2201181 RepID=A0A2U8QYC7_9FLAO|nr:RNA polymerase sigma factor [Flavobacterium sediminis]AWM14854.1 RNA polymerase subunit sigma-70 [Flavobacterium sediminis]